MSNESEVSYTTLCPDFPFDYLRWITTPNGIARLPESSVGTPVALLARDLPVWLPLSSSQKLV